MDQYTLSFGDTHTESLTLFNVQNVTLNQLTRTNSIDKLEIADESMPVTYHNASTNKPIKADPAKLEERKQKVTGKLRQILGNKENTDNQDTISTFLKKRDKGSYLRDISNEKLTSSMSCARTNPLLAQQLARKNQNSISTNSFTPHSHAAEFKMATMFMNKPEAQNHNSNKSQPSSIKLKSQKESIRNDIHELSIATPKVGPEFYFKSVPFVTLASNTPESKSISTEIVSGLIMPKDADSRLPMEDSKNESEKDKGKDRDKEKASRLRKMPKKIEVSLASNSSFNDSKFKHSRRGSLKTQQDHADDLIKKGEEIKEKKRALAESFEQNYLKHNAPRNNKQTAGRTFDEFLEDQSVFQERKEGRIKIAQLTSEHEKIVQEPVPIPKITQKAKEIMHKKESDPSYKKQVYQRLYESAKMRSINQKTASVPSLYPLETTQEDLSSLMKSQEDQKLSMKSSYTFQPQIDPKSKNIKRDERIEDILYRDAIRRHNKSVEGSRSTVSIPNKFSLDYSSKLLARKLLKEFEETANTFFKPMEDQVFSHSQLREFIVKIGFVKESHDTTSSYYIEDQCLIHAMWTILKGDVYHGVSKENVLTFLLAIMGLNPASALNRYNETPNGVASPTNILKTEVITRTEPDLGFLLDSVSPLRTMENMNLFTTTDTSQRDFLRESFIKSRTHKNRVSGTYNRASGSQKSNIGSTPDVTEHTLDTQNNQDTSTGISNFFTRKFSFQSDNFRTLETLVKEDFDQNGNKLALGRFDLNGRIAFTEEEIQKIAQTYDVFYYNRLYAKGSNAGVHNKATSSTQGKFHPDISDFSRHLAYKHREKQANDIEDTLMDSRSISPMMSRKMTHADLLIQHGMLNESRLDRQRQESVEKSLEECTFHPKINKHKKLINNKKLEVELNNGAGSIHHKGEHLYKLAAQSTKARIDKSNNDIEYEKCADECVFQPNVNKSKVYTGLSRRRQTEIPKDVEKSVERIKKGREQREQTRLLTENRACSPMDENLPRFCFALEKQDVDKKLSSLLNKQPAQAQKASTREGGKLNKSVGKTRKINPYTAGFDSKGKYDVYTSYKLRDRVNTVASLDESHEKLNRSSIRRVMGGHNNGVGETYTIEEGLANHCSAKNPMLFIDVNIGGPRSQRIVVYEGDTAEKLASKFALKHNLSEQLRRKLQELIQSQMHGTLSKIDEEMQSLQSEIEKTPQNDEDAQDAGSEGTE